MNVVAEKHQIPLKENSVFRYEITALILTSSPLAVHSGVSSHDERIMGQRETDPQKYPFRPTPRLPEGVSVKGQNPNGSTAGDHATAGQVAAKIHEGVDDCDALVVRDWQGQPMIPGSSLKGVFRNYFEQRSFTAQDQDVIHWMLGTDATKHGGGNGGAVIFEDAFLHKAATDDIRSTALSMPFFDSTSKTFVDQRTGVDRRTGAVREGALYNVEAVSPETSFHLHVSIDHGLYADKAAALLLQAFSAFELAPEESPPQLGSDTAVGWGRIRIPRDQIHLTKRFPDHMQPVPWQQVVPDASAAVPASRGSRLCIDLRLDFTSALICCDPARTVAHHSLGVLYCPQTQETIEGQLAPVPDLVPRIVDFEIDRQWGTLQAVPLLPASSFKGAFRSQLEFILRTIHSEIAVSPFGQIGSVSEGQDTPIAVQHLLGLESLQSGLRCSDFRGLEMMRLHLREMVAIDRFTGGAAASAKFNALVFESPHLTGTLTIEIPEDPEQAAFLGGALALVIRDLLQGQIYFGYGQTKGFGRCRASIMGIRQHGMSAATFGFNHESKFDSDRATFLSNDWFDQFLSASSEWPPDVKSEQLGITDNLIDHCLKILRTSITSS